MPTWFVASAGLKVIRLCLQFVNSLVCMMICMIEGTYVEKSEKLSLNIQTSARLKS